MSAALRPVSGPPGPAFDPLPFDPRLPAAERSRAIVEALPESLRLILDSGEIRRRSRFSEDGFDGLAEHWHPPPAVTVRDALLARRVLEDLERSVLAPAEPNHLLGRVLALLSHFPAKATAPEVEQMIALDWAEDLGEFPAWSIDQAARIWRRTRKWRPSIAELRSLCETACAEERALAARLRQVAEAAADLSAPPSRLPVAGRLRRMA